MSDILKQLQAELELRKQASAEQSYVAELHHKGLNKILEKVGEESTEFILASKDAERGDHATKQACVNEAADLWFHSLVALSHLNLTAEDILKELERRFGLSGLEEKKQRSN